MPTVGFKCSSLLTEQIEMRCRTSVTGKGREFSAGDIWMLGIWAGSIIFQFFFFFNSYSFYLFIYLFIYLFLAVLGLRFVRGLSLVAASGGHSSSRCAGLSLTRPLPTGSRRAGSAVVAHGPSRSAARGILPDQGSNPRPLHWQADSQPLRHQGSPIFQFLTRLVCAPASKALKYDTLLRYCAPWVERQCLQLMWDSRKLWWWHGGPFSLHLRKPTSLK